jgi:hypothetical protein
VCTVCGVECGEGVVVDRRERSVKGGEIEGFEKNKIKNQRQEKSGQRTDRGLVEAVDAQSAAALQRLVTWWRSCGSWAWG